MCRRGGFRTGERSPAESGVARSCYTRPGLESNLSHRQDLRQIRLGPGLGQFGSESDERRRRVSNGCGDSACDAINSDSGAATAARLPGDPGVIEGPVASAAVIRRS